MTTEGSKLEDTQRTLIVTIDRQILRLTKRIKAVLADLERGRAAALAAEQAQPFVPEAARAPRGTKSLVAIDWSSGEATTRELPLDPAKRPKDQVEAIFAQARRLKKGSVVANARLEEAHEKRTRLVTLREAVLAATRIEDITLAHELALRTDPSLLPGLPASSSAVLRKRDVGARLPYRTFLSSSGGRILVGRGAADNDELTLHVARPYDLWLHAKGVRGAHVIVPQKRGHDTASDLLVDAAHLAAHFSDARGETIVDVTYVPRRFVRKPRGSPVGQVLVDREKNLVLRVDAARLATLLAREAQEAQAKR